MGFSDIAVLEVHHHITTNHDYARKKRMEVMLRPTLLCTTSEDESSKYPSVFFLRKFRFFVTADFNGRIFFDVGSNMQ